MVSFLNCSHILSSQVKTQPYPYFLNLFKRAVAQKALPVMKDQFCKPFEEFLPDDRCHSITLLSYRFLQTISAFIYLNHNNKKIKTK